jgi:hypothetical protein
MEDLRREVQNAKEFNINKPKPFDGNRKDIQSFILDCRVYLQVNRNIYHNDDSKVAFILSFMNEKEAMRWKENYLLEIMNATGDLAFPAYADFMERLSKDFKPVNKGKDAAHQIAILRQGKKTAEETITEFRLLTNQAGYANTTASDHLHLIEKLQTVLNTNLVKRVLLLDDVPTRIDKWAEKAIQIDSNYRQTMETLDRLNGDKKSPKNNNARTNTSNNWRRKKEERDPDAMDVDAMSTGKRNYLMKKGACFICEEPGHRAKEHDDFVKERDEKKKGKAKANSQKKDLRALHNLFQGLTKAEKEELLSMSNGKDKKEKEEEVDSEDEDF